MYSIFDMNERSLTLVYDELKYEGDILIAKINRYGRVIPMSGVKFGFTLFINGVETIKAEWPPSNVIYKKTDQDILARYQLFWKADDNVKINVWLLDIFSVLHEDSLEFIAPRPPKPYPSWAWNEVAWQAPVPYPADGQFYDWDEDNQQWVIVTEE